MTSVHLSCPFSSARFNAYSPGRGEKRNVDRDLYTNQYNDYSLSMMLGNDFFRKRNNAVDTIIVIIRLYNKISLKLSLALTL